MQHWSQPRLTGPEPSGVTALVYQVVLDHMRHLQTLEARGGLDMDSLVDIIMHRGREVSLRGYASRTGPGDRCLIDRLEDIQI
jgi:hypothetical protein